MSAKSTSRARSLARVFAIPLALGVLSAVGLVAALVGDDIWDAIGWLALGLPLAVMTLCLLRNEPVRR